MWRATVMATWGSAPQGVGATLRFDANGFIEGSVSGGCVEGAVIEAGLAHPGVQVLNFGVADELAAEVGLACGGQLTVLVRPEDPALWAAIHAETEAGEPCAVLTRLADGAEWWLSARGGSAETPAWARTALQAALAAGHSQQHAEFFVQVVVPPPQLVVVGGGHISVALAALAHTLAWPVVVVDPRRALAHAERFPSAQRILNQWPDTALPALPLTSACAVAVLAHDPKLDDPALQVALPSPAFYVGALGGRTSQTQRRTRLLASGLTETHLNRLHAPIGLAIGARTPAEVALAVLAQVVAAWHQRHP